jgi:hypothetical protein
MEFGLKISKVDIITIVLLCIVFFSLATYNLGLTQTPTTTTQLKSGQSFYIDLGTQVNVNSMLFLLKGGAINATMYSGSPGNWVATSFPVN